MSSDSSTLNSTLKLTGGCDCGKVRYELQKRPIYVNCCHCRWCQRESGSAFAINAIIEASQVKNLGANPKAIQTPSASGKNQKMFRCDCCWISVWSNYAGAGGGLFFLRAGTLDNPDEVQPDIHIWTSSKQPWVILPSNIPIVEASYDKEKYWPLDSLQRFKRAQNEYTDEHAKE